jgi:hypothetical protein
MVDNGKNEYKIILYKAITIGVKWGVSDILEEFDSNIGLRHC